MESQINKLAKIINSKNTGKVLTKLMYLIILIFCVSICLLSFFIYKTSANIVTNRAENETLNLSRQVARQLNDSILMDINSLKSISQMLQTAININDALAEQLKVLTQFENIFIVNKNGKIANIAPFKFENINLDLNKTDFITHVLQEKKTFISSPQAGFWNYKAVVVAIPIFLDVGGGKWDFYGVIAAPIRIENLFKALNDLKIEQSGFAMVIDSDGNLLNSSNHNLSIKTIYPEIKKKSQGVTKLIDNGIENIIGFQKMEIQYWSILVTIPINEVLTDIFVLRKNVFILTSLFLFLTILFTLIIKYWAQKLHTTMEGNFIALQNMQSKLINSSKMSALGEMAGGIAHEINTPLGVIILRASQAKRMIAKDSRNVQAIQEYLDIIDSVAQQIAKIVQGLRGFSRAGDNDKSMVISVRTIFDNTLILCSEKLKQREILLIDEIQNSNLLVECKSVQISQVLLNLINNSCDAVMNQNEKWIKISVKELKNKVEFSVTDSGPKISNQIKEKLMQPFFTTKEVGKGTGLGLSLSKGIIEAHNGKFYIDQYSENTRFVFEITKSAQDNNKS